jgi:methionyl-tRNA formyltransferase
LALKHGIEVRTPASLKAPAEQAMFADLRADAAIVVAYGLLLPTTVLSAPTHGCFNIHASLLPRWRGAAPIQRAIMAGDNETGVSIMKMDEGLDTGPVCAMERMAITPEMTAGQLHDELAHMGARLIVETLRDMPPRCTPQPDGGVTYARKIDKAEARIDFDRDAAAVRNHIHGLAPFPGAWCMIGGARIKVLQCEIADLSGAPGMAIDDRLGIGCRTGAVRFLKVQREGKGPMDANAFLRGFPVPKGTDLS